MQKLSLLILVFFSFSVAAIEKEPKEARHLQHLSQLKAKFPYALLSDDFYVLTVKDLAINSCHANATEFVGKNLGYPYFQCFETAKISPRCAGAEYYASGEEVFVVLSFDIKEPTKETHYITRRGIELADCKSYQNDWKRLTKGEKYTCFSGEYGYDTTTKEGKVESNWIFDRYNTRKGCDSYFQGACSFAYQQKNGCKVKL